MTIFTKIISYELASRNEYVPLNEGLLKQCKLLF